MLVSNNNSLPQRQKYYLPGWKMDWSACTLIKLAQFPAICTIMLDYDILNIKT